MKIKTTYILYHDSNRSYANLEKLLNSCEIYSVNYITYRGIPVCEKEKIEKHLRIPMHWYYNGESECTYGHIKIWELIANQPDGHAYAVFEDDVMVKHYLDLVDVNDLEVVFLGFRVDNPNDYNYPLHLSMKKVHTKQFNGAHAYAITPRTAQVLLSKIKETGVVSSSDGMLGLNNPFQFVLSVQDPPPVVCWAREQRSFDPINPNDIEPEKLNYQLTEGFISGLDHKAYGKYLDRQITNWMK